MRKHCNRWVPRFKAGIGKANSNYWESTIRPGTRVPHQFHSASHLWGTAGLRNRVPSRFMKLPMRSAMSWSNPRRSTDLTITVVSKPRPVRKPVGGGEAAKNKKQKTKMSFARETNRIEPNQTYPTLPLTIRKVGKTRERRQTKELFRREIGTDRYIYITRDRREIQRDPAEHKEKTWMYLFG